MKLPYIILYSFLSVIVLILISAYLVKIYRAQKKRKQLAEKPKSKKIQFDLRGEILELDRLALILEDLDRYHVPVKTIFDLNVIIEEIFVSIVNHQKEDQPHPGISVTLLVETDLITATIKDSNDAFNPTIIPAIDLNAPIEEISFQGLGFQLVRHLADTVSYQRMDGQNILTLTKSFTRA